MEMRTGETRLHSVVHGGDVQSFIEAYGYEPLDFSSNVSPLGVPETVVRAVQDAAGRADAYPDRECRLLRKALAETEGVPPGRIVCGNGAADLIWRLVLAYRPKQALLCAPCFGEYEAALRFVRTRINTVHLTEAFQLPDAFPDAVTKETDMVLLSQPNNPSGVPLQPDVLEKLVARCRETGTLLLIDECFMGFMEEPEAYSAKPFLANCPDLLVLNAFTKLYGMAGLRLGYLLCGSEDAANRITETGQAWSVSNVAQAAGIAALRDTDYVTRVRSLVAKERARLYEALCGMGFHVMQGKANYLLLQSRTPLLLPLRERGILIRACGDYKGLDDTRYRVAVRTEEENERLLAALREVVL